MSLSLQGGTTTFQDGAGNCEGATIEGGVFIAGAVLVTKALFEKDQENLWKFV